MKPLYFASLILLAGGGALASGIDQFGSIHDERISMRIHQTVPIQFPQVMLQRGITEGMARVAISVDHTGQLTDVLVVSHSDEAFAQAAERGIRTWTYEAMRVRGEHVATQATLDVDFKAEGVVISISSGTDLNQTVLRFRVGTEYAPCPLQRLDQIPTPINFVEPDYSKELALHGIAGRAVIEFYIDESGSVRVPAVTDADYWELGVLAMSAVRQWRFVPPTSHGRPVLIRVRQVIHFGGETLKS